jgi:hypothetical protein
MLLGMVTDIAGLVALFPLDTIKTRLQATNSKHLLMSGKLFHGLYDGLGPALMSAAFLSAYGRLRRNMATHNTSARLVERLAAGAFTDFVISVPFEVSYHAPQHAMH